MVISKESSKKASKDTEKELDNNKGSYTLSSEQVTEAIKNKEHLKNIYTNYKLTPEQVDLALKNEESLSYLFEGQNLNEEQIDKAISKKLDLSYLYKKQVFTSKQIDKAIQTGIALFDLKRYQYKNLTLDQVSDINEKIRNEEKNKENIPEREKNAKQAGLSFTDIDRKQFLSDLKSGNYEVTEASTVEMMENPFNFLTESVKYEKSDDSIIARLKNGDYIRFRKKVNSPDEKNAKDNKESPKVARSWNGIDVYKASAEDLVSAAKKISYDMIMSVYKNLAKKKQNDTYDINTASKAFEDIINIAAKVWYNDMSQWATDESSALVRPSKDVKNQAAKDLLNEFEVKYTAQTLDFMKDSKETIVSNNKKSEYQGWKNYETWNFALHIDEPEFNDEIKRLIEEDRFDIFDLADYLKDFALENMPAVTSFYQDILEDIVANVIDYREVAQSYIKKFKDSINK